MCTFGQLGIPGLVRASSPCILLSIDWQTVLTLLATMDRHRHLHCFAKVHECLPHTPLLYLRHVALVAGSHGMCVVAATATNIQQDLGAGSGWASYPVPIAVGGTVLGSIAWELFSRFTLLGGECLYDMLVDTDTDRNWISVFVSMFNSDQVGS